MIRKGIISLLTLIALSAGVKAKEATESDIDEVSKEEVEEQKLQEQEFQTINHTNIDNKTNEEESFDLINPKDPSTNIKKISVKNEFFESIKVVLEPISEDMREDLIKKEFYLNAYENKDEVTVTRGVNYNVKVYNLYNEYLGEIYKPNIKSKNKLAISPFFLIREVKTKRDKPILANQPAREHNKDNENKDNENTETTKIQTKQTSQQTGLESSKGDEDNFKPITQSENFHSELITERHDEETEIFRTTNKESKNSTRDSSGQVKQKPETSPQPKEINLRSNKEPVISQTVNDIYYAENNKIRNIKVANISDKTIRLKLEDKDGTPIGGGWTIKNDLYVPQYLNFKSVPVEIKPDTRLIIDNSDTDTLIKKLAKELNIDEKGNYVWFID
jgi:hypothetical protein